MLHMTRLQTSAMKSVVKSRSHINLVVTLYFYIKNDIFLFDLSPVATEV